MAKVQPEMQSWQIFHFARKHLGAALLVGIFGRKNSRAVNYWCEDPRYTEKPEGAYDPILGVKNLLESLDDQGHVGVVRSCLDYLASGTSVGVDCHPVVTELQPTMVEEILADYQAVAALQQAIDNQECLEHVEVMMRQAVAEIERTFAKFKEVAGNK